MGILFTEKKAWTLGDLKPGDCFAVIGGIIGQMLLGGECVIFNYFNCGTFYGDDQPVTPIQVHIVWSESPVGEEYDSESAAVPFVTLDGHVFGAILDDKRRLIWVDGIPQFAPGDLAVRPITMHCYFTPFNQYPK